MSEGETQHLSLKGKHGTHLIEVLVVGVGLTSFMFFLCPWMVRLVPAGPDSRLWWNGWIMLDATLVRSANRKLSGIISDSSRELPETSSSRRSAPPSYTQV